MKSFVATFLFCICAMHAEPLPAKFDLDFRLGFLEGKYILIGRKPDSKETYTGTMTLKKNNNKLDVYRVIDGRTTHGIAYYDAVTPDQIVVLRMEFTVDENKISATYMCSTDSNNYARITGYTHVKDDHTKSVGLEALFPLSSMPEGAFKAEQDAAANP